MKDVVLRQKKDFRLKVYPEKSAGPFTVYGKEKPLDVIRISRNLTKHFTGVTEIMRMGPVKTRVRLSSQAQANAITGSERFAIEYSVYVPSREVEIDGVVTEEGLSTKMILDDGIGCFKNTNLNTVKIFDCYGLNSVSSVGGEKVLTPTNSYRVIFSGLTISTYLSIGVLRLPVRLFVPRVMNCDNCMQFDNTVKYCCNRTRCADCGGIHEDNLCPIVVRKCLHCEEPTHELSECSVYKQRGEKSSDP